MDEVAKKCEGVSTITETIEAAKSAKYAANDHDFFFKLSAQVCLDVLIEMKSPGCKFLFLTEKNLEK